MNIRTATPADFDALKDLHWRSSMVNDRDRDWMLANRDLATFEGKGLADGHVRIAEIDGDMVGFVTALPSGDFLELEDLFVDPACMRRGVASALIDDVRTRAGAAGVVGRVEVTANDHALAFYEAAGFVAVDTVDTLARAAIRMHLTL